MSRVSVTIGTHRTPAILASISGWGRRAVFFCCLLPALLFPALSLASTLAIDLPHAACSTLSEGAAATPTGSSSGQGHHAHATLEPASSHHESALPISVCQPDAPCDVQCAGMAAGCCAVSAMPQSASPDVLATAGGGPLYAGHRPDALQRSRTHPPFRPPIR